jgi:iron complex outermembrane recepter protein
LGSDDYKVGRVVVSFKPSASIDNDLFINEYHSSGKLPPYVPVAVNPNGAARAAIGPALDDFIARQIQLGPYKLVGTSLPGSIENTNNVKQTNVANITAVRLTDDFSLKNILGYSRLSSYEVFDADGTPYKIYDNNVPGSTPAGASELMTEELQAQGKALGGKFTYTGGVFYARSHPGKAGTVIADLTDVFGIQTSTTATSKFQTEAIYAQGTYDLDDAVKGLKATAGYRFTIDKRWLDQTSALIIPAFDLTIPNAPLNLKSESKNSSYTLGLTYQATPKTMYYFTNSKGFLNGGFNTSVTQAADAPFGPESLNNFELGVKSDFEIGGMQARANVAAYYGLYNDAQVSVTTLINAGTPQQALAVLTKNAAKGTIKGLEWNLQLVPSQAFQVAFFGSYMKNEYTKYASLDSQGQPIDLSGTPFVFVPKLKYGLSATAFMPIDEAYGELGVTASFTHQDEVITTSTLHPQWYDKGSAIDNLNLSVNWDQVMGKKGLSAAFFVNNALGQDDSNSGFGAYNSLGVFGLVAPPPRMYGLRVKQTF